MNGATVAWLACVAGLLGAPLAQAGPPSLDKAAAVKGQTSYLRYCVSCHGLWGKGDGPLASDLRVPVPNLTGLAAGVGGHFPYERVEQVIRSGEILRGHGSSDMPAWGDVFKKTKGTDAATADAAVRELTHYIWSIQTEAKEPPK
jgi:mono/diheme cytochrome c family protein